MAVERGEQRWIWYLLFLLAIPALHAQALNVSLVNASEAIVVEDTVFSQTCNVTCTEGACVNTTLSLEMHNGTAWVLVASAGNITLNGSQQNPLSLGDFGTQDATFVLYANQFSANNSIRCFAATNETSNWSAERNVSVIDDLPPNIVLSSPPNGSIGNRAAQFSFTATDKHLSNCSLWLNTSGWHRNSTIAPQSGVAANITVLLSLGTALWGVECVDLAGNAVRSDNRTFTAAPDFSIAEVRFLNMLVEGGNTTVWANITNPGNTSQSVSVEFWDGMPGQGTLLGNNTVTVDAASTVADANMIGAIGSGSIYVIVDAPNGSGAWMEYDETNNWASVNYTVSMWQTYYGNASGNVTLDTSMNFTFKSWYAVNRTGNIYVSDTDTQGGISFTDLHPFGKDILGGTVAGDFAELDTAINTTSFADSVNLTYTQAGIPREEENFTLYGQEIQDVPVQRSDANHTTGLLWDASDAMSASYMGAQDVVFVTRVGRQGSEHGVVDYVIRVPARLRDYRSGSPTVTFYYEVQ